MVKMYSEIIQIGIISLGWKSIVEIMQFIECSFAQISSDMKATILMSGKMLWRAKKCVSSYFFT